MMIYEIKLAGNSAQTTTVNTFSPVNIRQHGKQHVWIITHMLKYALSQIQQMHKMA